MKKPKTAKGQIFSPGGFLLMGFCLFLIMGFMLVKTQDELDKAERYITFMHANMPDSLIRKINKQYNQEQADRYDNQ